jgi:hypothetical protein
LSGTATLATRSAVAAQQVTIGSGEGGQGREREESSEELHFVHLLGLDAGINKNPKVGCEEQVKHTSDES